MEFRYELIRDGLAPKAPGPGDAGYDVFARCGWGATLNGAKVCAGPFDSITLCQGAVAVIPLGFRAIIPAGHHADLRPRSGWSSKGVHVALGLIDEGYRGEWCAIVTNLGTDPVTIEHGAKIAQVVFAETVLPEVVEAPVSVDTARGEGGFGSTGFGGVTMAQAVQGWSRFVESLPTPADLVKAFGPTDHACDNCDNIQPGTYINGPALPYAPPRDVAKAMEPDDGCTADNSQGFHIGETAYHDRHGQGWISRYIERGQTAIMIFLLAGTRAVDVHHLRPSSVGTKVPKPHVALAMALQSQRQTVGVGLDEMPDAALDVERGRLPLDDANVGIDEWLDRLKVNIADRAEWHRRASMARRSWGRELGDDRLAQLDPFKPGDLVWWSAERKVGEFRRNAGPEEHVAFPYPAPRAKVDFWDGEGWRLVPIADLTQPPPGRLMRLIREAAVKTMGETARLMGVSVARLSGWEMCQTEPPAGDDLVAWLRAIEPVSDEWSDAVVAYINSRRDQWSPPEPRPFAADTMRPDVSLPGEDSKRAEARARWMAAHHHGAGYHEWNESHPAPIGALRAWLDEGLGLGQNDAHALLGEIEWLRGRSAEADKRAALNAKAGDKEVDRLIGVICDIGEALGLDEDENNGIVDRATELMDGAREMERALDGIALAVGMSQEADEEHADYVGRIVKSVRDLRKDRDNLRVGEWALGKEVDRLRALCTEHREALDSIAAVSVDDAFDDGAGQVSPKDAAAVIVAHIGQVLAERDALRAIEAQRPGPIDALLDRGAKRSQLSSAVGRLFSRLHVAPAAGESIVDTLGRIGSLLGPVADMSGVVPEVEPGAWLVTLEDGRDRTDWRTMSTVPNIWTPEGDCWAILEWGNRLNPGDSIDGAIWLLPKPTPDAPLVRKIDVRPPADAPLAERPPCRPMLMLGPVQPHAHLRVEARAKAALAEKVEQERQQAVIPAPDGERWLAVWRRNGQTLDMEPWGGEWRNRAERWTATPGESVIRYGDETEVIVAWQWYG